MQTRFLTAAIAMAICAFALHAGPLGSAALAMPTAQEGASSETAAVREVSPDEIAAIAKTLNCPLCQGYRLQECPLEVCAQMRDLIGQSLAEGKSAEEIRASFVEEYGPQVLNAPPAEGFFLSAWWTPVLVLLGGAIWLAFRMRPTEIEPVAADTAGEPEIDIASDYQERVEALLRKGREG